MKTVILNQHEKEQPAQELLSNPEVEVLKQTLELLAEENARLLAEKPQKKESVFMKEIKVSFQQTFLNVIREPATTLTGVGVAVGIGFTHYPNIDSQVILEMLGFSSLGGMANSRKPASKPQAFKPDNFTELG